MKAVLSFKNIILIAGGYDKGAEYGELTGNFDGHVKELVLMGDTAPKIREAAEKVGFSKIHTVSDMQRGCPRCLCTCGSRGYGSPVSCLRQLGQIR